MKVIFFLSFYFICFLHAELLSDIQKQNLQTVREIALKYSDKKGETFPNTIASICMTESSCMINKISDIEIQEGKMYASLGAMQIRIPTARYLSSIFPKKLKQIHSLTDSQLRIKLLKDIKLSAKIASLYIVHLSNTRKNYFKTVSGYNGGMQNRPYYNRVIKWNIKLKKLKINTY